MRRFHSTFLAGSASGSKPLWNHLAIEQKRKLQSENSRFAGAVISAQQQSPILVVELFLVVSVEIYKAAPKRLPPFTLRFREVRLIGVSDCLSLSMLITCSCSHCEWG